ncbi:MAG: hypothetical protein IT433_12920 [Phycisphaerales bacterium]|nr:hypothetical protein [Phycisphaerales bacterium]
MDDIGKLDEQNRARKQETLNRVRDMLASAGFDVAVVLATYTTENGDTAAVTAYEGNWYAQTGLMRYALLKRDQIAVLEARKNIQMDEDGLDGG